MQRMDPSQDASLGPEGFRYLLVTYPSLIESRIGYRLSHWQEPYQQEIDIPGTTIQLLSSSRPIYSHASMAPGWLLFHFTSTDS